MTPTGWIVVGSHHLLLEIIEVEIHLSGVPMTKRSDLEIQQYVAAKETMVKDQVDIVVLIADGDPFLPGFKTKAGAQFQEECLQMIEEGGFEIRLAIRGPFGEPREFKHVRIAQERGDRGGRVLRASSADDGFLVGREAGTLVQRRRHETEFYARQASILLGNNACR